MPDRNSDIFGYSSIFKRTSPNVPKQILLLLIIGIAAGIFAFSMANFGSGSAMSTYRISRAAIAGMFIVSVPAILTAMIIKVVGRKVRLRHILLVTLGFSIVYSIFLIIGGIVVMFTHKPMLGDIAILVGNSLIFGYWIVAGKVLVGLQKSASFAAALQPFYNAVFYVVFGSAVIFLGMPIDLFFIKLVAGMVVFLFFSYLFIYVIDKPMKRTLDTSSVRALTIMVNQWLYDFGNVDLFTAQTFGVHKNIDIDILVLKSKSRYKAVFVNPNIHFGPFKNVGGSVATEVIGSMIQRRYNASPFVLHSAVNASDNPVGTSQVYSLSAEIRQYIDRLKEKDFSAAKGNIGIGRSGPCRAIDLKVNGFNMFVLTKAPMVVEDIDPQVGNDFRRIASLNGRRHAVIVDAHNSRFESASIVELQGVKRNSIYEERYKEAIKNAITKERSYKFRCGFACQKIDTWLNRPSDMGGGYTSVSVFEFDKKMFGMVYFDSNNMLPGFRDEIIKHIKEKFGFDVEVLTTDTHSVNGLNLPVSNVLGRETNPSEVKPIIDILLNRALGSMEPIYAHHGKMRIDNFRVWGNNAEKAITEIGRDLIKKTRRYAPFITLAGSIIASLIIYMA